MVMMMTDNVEKMVLMLKTDIVEKKRMGQKMDKVY